MSASLFQRLPAARPAAASSRSVDARPWQRGIESSITANPPRPPLSQMIDGAEAPDIDPTLFARPNGSGKPLPKAVRSKMEAAMGADFSGVRVHTGPHVDRLGAIAFTAGSAIHFAPGHYRPDTAHGQRVIGHELAHVLQQRAGRVRNPFHGGTAVVENETLEAEAHHLGSRAASLAMPGTMRGTLAPQVRSGRLHQNVPDVVQLWPSLPRWARAPLATAAGALAGAAGFYFTPGTLRERGAAAATTGLTAGALAYHALRPSAPAPRPVAPNAARTFSHAVRNRADFHRDLDRHLNSGTSFEDDKDYPGEASTLKVPGRHVTDVTQALRQQEQAQQELVGPVNEARGDIYDDTIEHHQAKNDLWRAWTARAAAGTTRNEASNPLARTWNRASHRWNQRDGDPVDQDFRDRTATTLARVIGTRSGHALMHHVHSEAADLGIPINFVEEKEGAAFNLSVSPGLNAEGTALRHLNVTVPSAGQYHDAQSFKRSHADGKGGGDVTQTGHALTAAPLDTDMFHEFVHAAHYLAMERRRRTAQASDRPETFAEDNAAYHVGLGGSQAVLGAQDNLAEASTIHRSGSLHNLGALVEHNATDEHSHPEVRALQQNAANAIGRIDTMAQEAHIPAENTYREEIGLLPRQDHRALRLANGTYEDTDPLHRIRLT
jgi:hypothetical protein